MPVGTITGPPGSFITISLERFETPEGRVLDANIIEEEELISAGVDGRRHREVGRRYRAFEASTTETTEDYVYAVVLARDIELLIGKDVRLELTNLGGGAFTYERVHVNNVRAVARPGKVAGSANFATHSASVECAWNLVLKEVVAGVNP